MMMKAFVDTTVLTDALLKPGAPRRRAVAALARFAETELPVYAIKELKAGPLAAYRWMHNLLVTEGSLGKVLGKLQSMSRTPRRNLTSTAIESLATIAAELNRTQLDRLRDVYGATASLDQVIADEYRLGLRAIIHKAWRNRRRVTTTVVNTLSCYREVELREERGLIVLDPLGCTLEPYCCMAPQFRSAPGELQALENAASSMGDGREHKKRRKALRHLRRTSRPLTRDACRDLGDAVFAFFAPAGATILTTNTRDHAPLAGALGKSVQAP